MTSITLWTPPELPDCHFARYPTPLQSAAHAARKAFHAKTRALAERQRALSGPAVVLVQGEAAGAIEDLPLVLQDYREARHKHRSLLRSLPPRIRARRKLAKEAVRILWRSGVTWSDIISASRFLLVTRPRHLLIILVKRSTGWSESELGRVFHRDHTSIRNAFSKHGLLPPRKRSDGKFRTALDQRGGA